MTRINILKRYFNTLKYLKFKQVCYRLLRLFYKPRPINYTYNGSVNFDIVNVDFREKKNTYLGQGKFKFINSIGQYGDWYNEAESLLWNYNLHYFDFLSSNMSTNSFTLCCDLINDWIKCNNIAIGWAPYPSSLRIVNWIKFFTINKLHDEKFNSSLYSQVDFLYKNIEYHILGNHLFENAKALIFAGLYFNDSNATKWLNKGLNILNQEITEQILPDGGNFELSPMYHNIILEGILELYSLSLTNKQLLSFKDVLNRKAINMLDFSKSMSHPDGEVSFFNDSAIGIAPNYRHLESYAKTLNLTVEPKLTNIGGRFYNDSGYCILENMNAKIILDIAKVGPDYLPGHAHADTLSFEASFYGFRVFVNSGTSVYGSAEERLRQRKTFAHNTVQINNMDSSEVWGGFRVASRAYPEINEMSINSSISKVSASHNGYFRLNNKVKHIRSWLFTDSYFEVDDKLEGVFDSALGFIYLHPDIKFEVINPQRIFLILPNSKILNVESSCAIQINDSTYHPEFGVSIPNKQLSFSFTKPHFTLKVVYR